MKQVSYWARDHVWPSRFLLVAAHIMLSAWAIYAGIWLTAQGIEFSKNLPGLVVCVLSIASLAYPIRGKVRGILKYSYRLQKSLDGIIVFCGLLLLAASGQYFTKYCEIENTPLPITKSVAIKSASPIDFRKINKKPTGRISSLNYVWQSAKSGVKEHIKALRSTKLKAWQVGLVVLSIAVAMFLLLLTILLSCDLGCNGNGALAAVVFFGGLLLTIFLYSLALRAIFKRTENVKQGLIGGLLALVAAIAAYLILK